MSKPFWIILSFALGASALSGCAAAIGAGAVVAADQLAEQDGDEGLF